MLFQIGLRENAGVGAQNVHTPVLLHHLRNQAAAVGLAGDVERVKVGTQRLGGGLAGGFVDVGHHHSGTGLPQHGGNAFADAFGGTGNDGDLVLQAE
jgi:hypothetical protein